MAHIWEDNVVETSTTTGTGALTLAGAETGAQAFSAVMTSPSDTCYYSIIAIDGDGVPTGEWETGLGTYSAANTLTRTTVIASSNAGSVVTLSAGTKRVSICMISQDAANLYEQGSKAAGIDSRFWFAQEYGADEGYDEEFDGVGIADDTLPATWVWDNQDTAVYRQSFGAGRVDWGGGSSDIYDLHSVLFPFASTSWVAYAHMLAQCEDTVTYVNSLVLHNSANGRKIVAGVYKSADTAEPQLFLSYYASADPAGATTITTGPKVSPNGPHIYFRITKNSNTDYDWHFSYDGACWFELAAGIDVSTAGRLNGNPTHIGFAANSPFPCHCGMEWLRIRNVA